ncbi:MAG: hypothetical protein WC197_07175, partial [Candidatus Gastranaerophilaceae bacterium]
MRVKRSNPATIILLGLPRQAFSLPRNDEASRKTMELNLTKLSFEGNNQPIEKQATGGISTVNNPNPASVPISKEASNALRGYVLSKTPSFKGSVESPEKGYIPEGMTDVEQIAEILLKIEVDGKKRFDNAYSFEEHLKSSLREKPENIQYLDKLLNARNGKLQAFDIGCVLSVLNKNNVQYLDPLLKARNEKLLGMDIGGVLSVLNKDNGQYLDTLLKARNGQLDYIGNILSVVNKDNGQYLDTLLKNEKLSSYDIECILPKLNKDNGSLVQLKNAKNELIGSKEINVYLNSGEAYKTLQSKTAINQLSLKEKRALLRMLVKDNSILFGCDFGNAMTLLPKNKDQYCSLMKKLVKSMDGDSKPLTETAKKSCFDAINALGNSQNKDIESDLNKITQVFPELKIDTDTLKTLQEVTKDSRYKALNENDKHILQLAALFHNIDKDSPKDSAFDAYMLTERHGISNADEATLHSIISCQDWQKADDESEAKDIAYELRRGNSFELAKILSDSKTSVQRHCEEHSDEAIQINHSTWIAASGFSLPRNDRGSQEGLEGGNAALKTGNNKIAELIEKYIKEIQSTEIALPQTKIPKASQIKAERGIKEVETGGFLHCFHCIKNKVIYMSQNPDLEAAGFDKGTKLDNFYALVHAFDDKDFGVDGKIAQFIGLKSIENDSLLSTSFIKSDDYKVFRPQGFILDVDKGGIGAAYFRDFGSGYQKYEKELKRDYIFGNAQKKQRNYISDNLKKVLGYSDEQYIELMD